MREIRKIIVHTSDSPDTMDIGAKEIRQWHTDPKPKGNGWSDIGYHFVIRRDGTVEKGRDISVVGAHVRGQNHDSIGICWVGRKEMTDAQKKSLYDLLTKLLKDHKLKVEDVYGHREFESGKTCPNIDPQIIRDELKKKSQVSSEPSRSSVTGELPDGPSESDIADKLKEIEKDILG